MSLRRVPGVSALNATFAAGTVIAQKAGSSSSTTHLHPPQQISQSLPVSAKVKSPVPFTPSALTTDSASSSDFGTINHQRVGHPQISPQATYRWSVSSSQYTAGSRYGDRRRRRASGRFSRACRIAIRLLRPHKSRRLRVLKPKRVSRSPKRDNPQFNISQPYNPNHTAGPSDRPLIRIDCFIPGHKTSNASQWIEAHRTNYIPGRLISAAPQIVITGPKALTMAPQDSQGNMSANNCQLTASEAQQFLPVKMDAGVSPVKERVAHFSEARVGIEASYLNGDANPSSSRKVGAQALPVPSEEARSEKETTGLEQILCSTEQQLNKWKGRATQQRLFARAWEESHIRQRKEVAALKAMVERLRSEIKFLEGRVTELAGNPTIHDEELFSCPAPPPTYQILRKPLRRQYTQGNDGMAHELSPTSGSSITKQTRQPAELGTVTNSIESPVTSTTSQPKVVIRSSTYLPFALSTELSQLTTNNENVPPITPSSSTCSAKSSSVSFCSRSSQTDKTGASSLTDDCGASSDNCSLAEHPSSSGRYEMPGRAREGAFRFGSRTQYGTPRTQYETEKKRFLSGFEFEKHSGLEFNPNVWR